MISSMYAGYFTPTALAMSRWSSAWSERSSIFEDAAWAGALYVRRFLYDRDDDAHWEWLGPIESFFNRTDHPIPFDVEAMKRFLLE